MPAAVPGRGGYADRPVRLERAFPVTPADLTGRVTTAADREQYAADLAASHGRSPDLGSGDDGPVSYADLAAAAAGRIGAGVDLVVTAAPVPDCQARVLPGCLLADRLGGRPLLLGVHDQGAASAFTAVRLAAGRIRTGEASRAVVVVMERPGGSLPDRAGAVVLLLGRTGRHRLSGLTIRRISPGRARRARYLEPWAGLVRALTERPGAPVALSDRDEALGYECRLRFTARVTATGSPAPVLSTAGSQP